MSKISILLKQIKPITKKIKELCSEPLDVLNTKHVQIFVSCAVIDFKQSF